MGAWAGVCLGRFVMVVPGQASCLGKRVCLGRRVTVLLEQVRMLGQVGCLGKRVFPEEIHTQWRVGVESFI